MRYNNILVVGIVLILGNTSMSIQIMVDLGQRYPEVTERTPLRSNGNPYQRKPQMYFEGKPDGRIWKTRFLCGIRIKLGLSNGLKPNPMPKSDLIVYRSRAAACEMVSDISKTVERQMLGSLELPHHQLLSCPALL